MRTLHRSSLWLALVVTACGSHETSDRQRTDENAAVPTSTAIAQLLAQIRNYGSTRTTANAPAGAVATLLQPGTIEFERSGSVLVPLLPADATQVQTARVRLPERADADLTLSDASVELALTARLHGARSVEAQIADGLVVYARAGAQEETWIHRVSEHGTEDYFAFERAPAVPRVAYTVTLSAEVAGLRLVSNTLEFLDRTGVPRLRVAPPYLVDDGGSVHDATLAVEGCAVDRSETPPWGRAVTAPGATSCEILVNWEGRQVRYPALLDPAWTATASMASARMGHTAVLLKDGRVLVAGGSNATGTSALRSAELFDPKTRTWAATGQMATARAEHAATLRGDSVVVSGGWDGATVHPSAESYDPSTGAWTALPAMQSARRQHTATLLPDGQLLVAGGRSESADLASAERLSPSNTWSSAGNLLAAQVGHTATALSNGKLLVVGPNSPAGELYDPASNIWSRTATEPLARQFHSATAVEGGGVIVAGGANGARSVERYDPSKNSWSRVGSLSYEHSGHAAARLSNGRVLVVGGSASVRRTAAELFNPTWGTWTPSAPNASVVTPRSAHVAVALNDGTVLVAGGVPVGSTAASASAEIFDPNGEPVTVSEYKLPAGIDPEVLDGVHTELWAALHRPATLVDGRRYPLLVFLHGNHSTCGKGSNPRQDDNSQYTDTGACPDGYVVVPNHRGYDYVASELAGRGYLVLSINANRGITGASSGPEGDGNLILARGRQVLKHLQRLSEWDRGLQATPSSLGVSLQGHIDFGEVGLMGHSRGGEGVRAAYQQYRDPDSPWPGRIGPVKFSGIFEIGPVDGQSKRVLNAEETRWNVLLPACDGDVKNLNGITVFDRMMSIQEPAPFAKSTQHQWGANHNYYNTEWQKSDAKDKDCWNHRAMFVSDGSVSGSAEQRQTGLFSMLAFFTANVGRERDTPYEAIFDPQFVFRPENPVNRGYHPGGGSTLSLMLEDFLKPKGTSSYDLPNETGPDITVYHHHFSPHTSDFTAGAIDWEHGGPDAFFQSNWAASGNGFDLSGYRFLDLRVDRSNYIFKANTTTFTLRLVNANGSFSSEVPITDFLALATPPRSVPVLQTARIPLTRFTSANLASVRGVRLTATGDEAGAIYLGNIRATRSISDFVPLSPDGAAYGPASAAVVASLPGQSLIAVPPETITAGNVVRSVRSVGADTIEVSLESSVPFLPHDETLFLGIGTESTPRFSYPQGAHGAVRFQLDRAAWDRLADGAPIRVRYGEPGASAEWAFGPLDKALLDR